MMHCAPTPLFTVLFDIDVFAIRSLFTRNSFMQFLQQKPWQWF